MSNKSKKKKKKIKNLYLLLFDDRINIKNVDPNKIKIDEKSYRNILIYHIGYVTIKSQLKVKSVNPVYLIINKINR